jgi:hypothetical protein
MRTYSIGTICWRNLSALALALILCGCGDQVAEPPARPSPTLAAPLVRPSPTLGVPGTTAARLPATRAPVAPPATATPPAGSPAQPGPPAPAAPFAYLWPAYLPANMQISPAESRVPREGEVGQNDLGFFIVTFTDGPAKLVIGGGATETLPLTGEQRRITVGGRTATLTINGSQHQLAFDVPKGSLFVYSSSLSEDELLRVADSLKPIDLLELRKRVGAE